MTSLIETKEAPNVGAVHTNNDGNTPQHSGRSGRGRLYIPHGRGKEVPYKPHAQHVNVSYTECGPDWSSMLRYLSPARLRKKETDTTFYPPLTRLRHFPAKHNATSKAEYNFYPPHGIPKAYKDGKLTWFEGIHRANHQTYNEVTDLTRFGHKGWVPDSRDGYPETSLGDKPYRRPEYSPEFHKLGSTRPVVNFGGWKAEVADTFIPLQPLPPIPVRPYTVLESERKRKLEIGEVESLEQWRPATPLQVPTTDWR